MAAGSDRAPVRRGRRAGALALGAAAVGAAWWIAREVPMAMGARPSGDRAERVRRSAQFHDGRFRNDSTGRPDIAPEDRHRMWEFLLRGPHRKPAGPMPVVAERPAALPTDGLRTTWYGHATTLVEIEGARVLIDPIWSTRCSPSQQVGPRRLYAPPVGLGELPALDAVVISHDHYDHLDMATVRALAETQTAPFVVPLGVGAHLERWGVPADRIVELDWGQQVELAGITLTCTAAQHFSGRTATNRNYTLWASWVLAGATRRVFYTGDSGYFDGYKAIGAEHGPFDVALMQCGAYDAAWPDIHMTPEEAVAAYLDLGARLLIPVHWGTFVLAFHPWDEPIERLWREAKARGARLAVPRPGEPVTTDDPPAVEAWWQALR